MEPVTGILRAVGDSVTFKGVAGSCPNFVRLSGRYVGLRLAISGSNPGGRIFSPVTAKSLTGKGSGARWSPDCHEVALWDCSDLECGSSLKVACLAIEGGEALVEISSEAFKDEPKAAMPVDETPPPAAESDPEPEAPAPAPRRRGH